MIKNVTCVFTIDLLDFAKKNLGVSHEKTHELLEPIFVDLNNKGYLKDIDKTYRNYDWMDQQGSEIMEKFIKSTSSESTLILLR